MVRRRNRLLTDALREVRHTFSRFLSILVLSALAVAFLAGLRATAPDMEYTADKYYDRTGFMDGYAISTMGITEEDLAALAAAEGVETVEGVRMVDATATDRIVNVRPVPQKLNTLEVVKGRLPQAADECVTDGLLLTQLGLELGDTLTLTLEEGDEENLARTSFTVVGTVICPLYVGTDRGTTSLGDGSLDGIVYVPGENLTADYYSIVYFTGSGLSALDSYGDEYDQRMTALVDGLEPFGDERAHLRWQSIVDEAQGEIDKAQGELDDARATAERELADAKAELDDAAEKLNQGWQDYHDGTATLERELEQGRAELARARADLLDAEAQYSTGLTQYNEGLEQYQQRRREYEEGLAQYEQNTAALDEQQEALDAAYAQYEAALAPYVGTPYYDMAVAQAAEQKAQLDAAQGQLDEGYLQLALVKAQLDAAAPELEQAAQTLDSTLTQLNEAKAEIDSGWAQYRRGLTDLDKAEEEGLAKLADALGELNRGEKDYAQGVADYETAKAEAEQEINDAQAKLNDAQAELDDLEECEWYVLGRDTNSGFVSYSQDAERVGNLANVFPIIFFLVAALACLTTMTRMVEDQRTQIGALKAMGFSRLSISVKYLGYAFFASLVGGLLGLTVGCTIIPKVIANAFNIMYHIPKLEFRQQPLLCIIAVAAAVLCTTGAALWACLSTLVDTPANLMRPKAPKAGRRVFLEYVKPIWRRLSFTYKVTMRNLFRYQKRFWMTVIGIGGCTALIVTGFGLHDSIFAILDKQFDEISVYDASVGLDTHMTGAERQQVEDYLDASPAVDRWLACHQSSTEVSAGSLGHSAYIFAMEDQEAFRSLIDLRERKGGEGLEISPDGVVITEKLSELLEVSVGDTIVMEGDRRVEATVTAIAENYVYHYVYMTEAFYRTLFREEAKENTLLVAYADSADAAARDQVSVELMKLAGVSSYSNIGTMRETFTNSMSAIDYAVIIIIVAAAALAFVVLYNLTNINITERMRELATLKVLGFHDRETTAYIVRENVFLTVFGILLGLVMGRFLHGWMVLTVEVDMVMFGRTAPTYAYLLAAALTVLFSVMVNLAAHFRLKKVDMVESLKTVE